MKSDKKYDIDKIIGNVFKEYRKNNNLTQENIAEKLGISVKYISRIENGSGGVKVETLVNYINLLGISPNLIFDKLVENQNLKQEIDLSRKIKNLSNDKLNFILEIVDLIEKL